jgi:hypothetical protein
LGILPVLDKQKKYFQHFNLKHNKPLIKSDLGETMFNSNKTEKLRIVPERN